MSNNPYQSKREARNTLPGFFMLVAFILASIFVIREVAIYINSLGAITD
ncbi:hypothetical protein [Marinoscillum pacificum]|nr:hypothetical protein [Marinoscillum pacificum]